MSSRALTLNISLVDGGLALMRDFPKADFAMPCAGWVVALCGGSLLMVFVRGFFLWSLCDEVCL